jgi:hypothetical protein
MSNDNDFDLIIEILIEIFGDEKSHNNFKGQMSFDCPTCSYDIKGLNEGDGKGNLEINYKQKLFKCWVCSETHDTRGSLYKLIKKFGNKKQLKKYELFAPDDVNEFKKTYKPVNLPKEFTPLKSVNSGFKMTHYYKQVMNYLKSRNIGDELINKYNIGFCYEGLFQNRVIIPSYDEYGKVNYFIARSYLSKPKRKYINPESEKEVLVWNEHIINWDEPVYIVEGVFDSIFLQNSIPILGKKMSDKLFNLLYTKAKKIIIVFDPDAWADSEKLYHKLNCGKLFGKVYVIKLEGDKDIAELEGNLDGYIEFKID